VTKFGALRCGFALSALLSIGSTAALAHHSFSNFDMDQSLTLTGTVKRWEWTNPHSYLYVDVTDDKGPTTWAVEFHAIGQLLRLGLTKSTFQPGDKVSVTVHPSHDGSKLTFFSRITLSDGRTIASAKL